MASQRCICYCWEFNLINTVFDLIPRVVEHCSRVYWMPRREQEEELDPSELSKKCISGQCPCSFTSLREEGFWNFLANKKQRSGYLFMIFHEMLSAAALVTCPTRWFLSLIFGFLWWSSVSTPKYQRETGYSNVLQQYHIHSSLPSSRHDMLKFRRVKHGMLWYRGI